ncbi:UDP-N-acetylmuramoyl-L-alanine--D-glutamate ligase [Campylobacter sp. JMF_02 ED1]|uniref:UDP-N-acetylmuramoyl-L-alanine--D-glutamate ligase n=1 Tax=unclassified Campylobacter TaxID=2593542 RepID=UPI0022EA0A65|nr:MULTISPECIES: UDP-N-acetylmuramoyl-L-alanine--D-glutamate ligase [unclassified Campylobacter]MDA3048933.1 UDP-N-acetylmuramoyl-L-alanine--D-glutamate ligase [Campylobacter sp. JMF_15 NE4]MDA3050356.1 UDP-N-acetylmuramoyl-L-alanine--D-glutamate ligase [Campylobacter sp. JMF_02 ED1]
MKKSLFGHGTTTKALAKSGGWDIYDDNFKADEVKFDEFDNALLAPCLFDPAKSELEIPSPGFPKEHNLVKTARNLISEYDYFANTAPFKIWISGTNGKTTTTQMTQHLLASNGSLMGGNVGTPLALLDKSAKIWILETSSFTIHYTRTAHPGIYALLPITPDHLSWHGSFAEYERVKLSPLLAMSEGSVALIPAAYASSEAVKNSRARVICYEYEKDLAAKFEIEIEKISFKTPFLLDAILALCIEKILTDRASVEVLNEFVIEANKLEEFFDVKNRMWVNDTKATNIDACAQALKRYKDKKIHLILGGDDKGVDLEPLFASFAPYDLKIYAIGSNTDKLVNLCEKFKIPCIRCEFLKNAVAKIDENFSGAGEVALLSPACASLDQFKSYAQRGNLFKECVANLAL